VFGKKAHELAVALESWGPFYRVLVIGWSHSNVETDLLGVGAAKVRRRSARRTTLRSLYVGEEIELVDAATVNLVLSCLVCHAPVKRQTITACNKLIVYCSIWPRP
jgi:hypothetical protein